MAGCPSKVRDVSVPLSEGPEGLGPLPTRSWDDGQARGAAVGAAGGHAQRVVVSEVTKAVQGAWLGAGGRGGSSWLTGSRAGAPGEQTLGLGTLTTGCFYTTSPEAGYTPLWPVPARTAVGCKVTVGRVVSPGQEL